jgi:hypothetical protein
MTTAQKAACIVATFAKLRTGAWGVKGPNLREGERVTIHKKDGSTQTKTVGRILWTGPDGATLATLAPDSERPSSRRIREDIYEEFDDRAERRHEAAEDWDDFYSADGDTGGSF